MQIHTWNLTHNAFIHTRVLWGAKGPIISYGVTQEDRNEGERNENANAVKHVQVDQPLEPSTTEAVSMLIAQSEPGLPTVSLSPRSVCSKSSVMKA